MNCIEISFDKNYETKYSITITNDGRILAELHTSPDKNYYDEVSDIDSILKDNYKYYKGLKGTCEEEEKEITEQLKKGNNYYMNIDSIFISGTYEEIFTFFNSNKDLINKNIVIEKVKYTKKDYKSIKQLSKYPNIKVRASHDIGSISIIQYMETYEKLYEIILTIKKYDLSPIEQLMYVYDIVRDRIYNEETDGNAKSSRNLSNVLNGDKIVCAGFANIFDEICQNLGFKSLVYKLGNKDDWHARNIVYVNDPKYKINGIYFFDATWDCKKNESNDFLNSYKYFARTKSEIACLSNYMFKEESCKYLNSNLLEKYMECKDTNVITTVSNLLKLMEGNLIPFMDIVMYEPNIVEKVKVYSQLTNNKISVDLFEKIFSNVRKIEHKENNEKYSIDKKDLQSAIDSYEVNIEFINFKRLIKKLGV